MLNDAEPSPVLNSGVFTRERVLTLTLILATLLALYVCYRIVEPFIPPIAFALALVVATQGPYRWLRGKLRSPNLTATVAVILVLTLIIAPAVSLVTYLVQNAIHSINEIRTVDSNWRAMLEGQPILANLLEWAEAHLDLESHLTRAGEGIASYATEFLKGSASIVTKLGITVFVLFFMYRDCDSGMQTLYRLVPLSRTEAQRMFSHVAQTLRATVNGSLTVGAVQALMAGLMYMALGVPGAILWASATFFAALVPVFGTALIWGPISLFLLLTGSWGKALILLSWGCVAIGMIDNFLYPFLVGGKLRLHTVPTFFSIVGGVALFGASGLILGPMTLAITIGLIDVWWHRTSEGQAAEEEVIQPAGGSSPAAMLH